MVPDDVLVVDTEHAHASHIDDIPIEVVIQSGYFAVLRVYDDGFASVGACRGAFDDDDVALLVIVHVSEMHAPALADADMPFDPVNDIAAVRAAYGEDTWMQPGRAVHPPAVRVFRQSVPR